MPSRFTEAHPPAQNAGRMGQPDLTIKHGPAPNRLERNVRAKLRQKEKRVEQAFDLDDISNTQAAPSFAQFAKGGSSERSHQKEIDLGAAASSPTHCRVLCGRSLPGAKSKGGPPPGERKSE